VIASVDLRLEKEDYGVVAVAVVVVVVVVVAAAVAAGKGGIGKEKDWVKLWHLTLMLDFESLQERTDVAVDLIEIEVRMGIEVDEREGLETVVMKESRQSLS